MFIFVILYDSKSYNQSLSLSILPAVTYEAVGHGVVVAILYECNDGRYKICLSIYFYRNNLLVKPCLLQVAVPSCP